MNKYELTFGSDPEFFALKDGYCYPPALFRVKHKVEPLEVFSKESGFPHYIYKKENGITLMDDGAAFELTVPPVELEEPEVLYEYIQTGYQWGEKLFNEFGTEFFSRPTVKFDLSIFEDEYMEELETSTIHGCDADYDAYDEEFKAEQFSVGAYPYRHAGGHFIVGTKNLELLNSMHEYVVPLVKLYSFTIGAVALINSPYPKEEAIRQNYYGKPGKHRYPVYGVEYRSPSVSWTMNKELYSKMFEASEKAVELFLNPKIGAKLINTYEVAFFNAYKAIDLETLNEIHNLVMES